MHPVQPLFTAESPPRRSTFVTVLAWTIIVASALVVPVSAVSLLMVLARSHGTQSATLGGFLLVVVVPPAALVTGIGLWRRRAWAWWGVLALLSLVIALQVHELRTWRETTTTYTSPSGVETTVLGSGQNEHSVPIIAVCALLILSLLSRPMRAELGIAWPSGRSDAPEANAGSPGRGDPAPADRGWRVGHRGRDAIYYEERWAFGWRRIEIDGEMLMGRAHHVFYFPSPERWRQYPAWARDRRDEIVGRIKSALRPPDYEYHEGGSVPSSAPVTPPPARPAEPVVPASQRAALLLAIVLLLGVAGGLGWLVRTGLAEGTTILPAKAAWQRRPVSRAEEPATFWLAIGVYSVLGFGAGGLALWGLVHVPRRGRPPHG